MRPTLRGVLVLAASVPAALLVALVWTRLWTVWAAALVLGLLAVGLDALLGLRRLDATVVVPPTLYIGDQSDRLVVTLRYPGRTEVEVLPELDEELVPQPARRVTVEGQAEVAFPLVARRRGTLAVRAIWLRWPGPLGLTIRQRRVALVQKVAVLPNIRAVRAAAIRFFRSADAQSGLKIERFLGDGSEFESLREFVRGMDHRAIDWKASARHKKLLGQEFRAERNHQVILAVDTGHLMREPLGDIPKLDHAVNAALLLAYVGLKTGDRVGLCGFDERLRSFLEPQSGVNAFPRLVEASAELAYSTAETNFTLAVAELSIRLRRRSLVVILTDFVDTVTTELMTRNLDRLARRHLVLFVSIRDPSLGALVEAPPQEAADVYRAVVAGDFARERDVVLKRLRRMGVATIDALPGQVTTQLLNQYLDIKRRERV